MPAFAVAQAAMDVSLSSSSSSDLSASASQCILPDAGANQAAPAVNIAISNNNEAAQQAPTNAQAATQLPAAAQILSQLDHLKWDHIAAWAAGDSAQAAALVQHLGPSVAASVVSEPDRDQALLRLEAQVARKKLVRNI